MKNKIIRKCVAGLATATLGVAMMLPAMGIVAGATTSDEVELSVNVPGAGEVITLNDPLNVHSSASIDSPRVASLAKGSYVMIVERLDSFYKVQYDENGNYGYVVDYYIREADCPEYAKPNTGGVPLRIREGASTSSNRLGAIPGNAYFPILDNYGSPTVWPYVVYGKTQGFVSPDHITRYQYR